MQIHFFPRKKSIADCEITKNNFSSYESRFSEASCWMLLRKNCSRRWSGEPDGTAIDAFALSDLRGPRRRTAKLRSLDGNRGVFFFSSVTSLTDKWPSKTIFGFNRDTNHAIFPHNLLLSVLSILWLTTSNSLTQNHSYVIQLRFLIWIKTWLKNSANS